MPTVQGAASGTSDKKLDVVLIETMVAPENLRILAGSKNEDREFYQKETVWRRATSGNYYYDVSVRMKTKISRLLPSF